MKTLIKKKWNSRYVRFAISQNRSAGNQLAHDKAKPGACMVDYILWINARWSEFAEASGLTRDQCRLKHSEFDAWLAIQYPGEV